MVSELAEWIKNAEEKGFSQRKLKAFLIHKGYNKKDVKKAFKEIEEEKEQIRKIEDQEKESIEFEAPEENTLEKQKPKKKRTQKQNFVLKKIISLFMIMIFLGAISFSLFYFKDNIFSFLNSKKEQEQTTPLTKEQMVDMMRDSNSVIEISSSKIRITPSQETQMFIGYKNSFDDMKKFHIKEIRAKKLNDDIFNTFKSDIDDFSIAMDPQNTKGTCGLKMGYSSNAFFSPENTQVYVGLKYSPTSVLKNSVTVFPITINSLSYASKGTCVYEIDIYYGKDIKNPEEKKTIRLEIEITD